METDQHRNGEDKQDITGKQFAWVFSASYIILSHTLLPGIYIKKNTSVTNGKELSPLNNKIMCKWTSGKSKKIKVIKERKKKLWTTQCVCACAHACTRVCVRWLPDLWFWSQVNKYMGYVLCNSSYLQVPVEQKPIWNGKLLRFNGI
jgi:hypothetical protein